ncbi:acyl-CoA carboxylase subunit epsilon [Catelliglobosispora koreensis]|uniref:acyl-CoA carboxylase subunit epsilon n=1 Tax=Catelliglobosispora koreensis TaxID=129052 RepID=UPI0003A04511|nr:acyl-CoA carboxylase subunit epsilon [Catelliglobosispora koreensis]
MKIVVERGNPTAEEIAALVSVLTAVPVSTSEAAPAPSMWWRSGLPAHRGSWRESGLPHLSQA